MYKNIIYITLSLLAYHVTCKAMVDDLRQTYKISLPVAHAYNTMIKHGIKNATHKGHTGVHAIYEAINSDGIAEQTKRKKILPLTEAIETEVLENVYIDMARNEAMHLISNHHSNAERFVALRLLKKLSYKALEESLRNRIPGIVLCASIAQTIDANRTLELTDKHIDTFKAGQVAIVSAIQTLYEHDEDSFKELYGKWIPQESDSCTML